MTIDEKGWFMSRTIWVALIGGVAALLVIIWGDEMAVVGKYKDDLAAGIVAVANILAIYFRRDASRAIRPGIK